MSQWKWWSSLQFFPWHWRPQCHLQSWWNRSRKKVLVALPDVNACFVSRCAMETMQPMSNVCHSSLTSFLWTCTWTCGWFPLLNGWVRILSFSLGHCRGRTTKFGCAIEMENCTMIVTDCLSHHNDQCNAVVRPCLSHLHAGARKQKHHKHNPQGNINTTHIDLDCFFHSVKILQKNWVLCIVRWTRTRENAETQFLNCGSS